MGLGEMKQLTLAMAGFERYAKTTRRVVFLAEMERVVPWSALCASIEPFYPKPGKWPPAGRGRADPVLLLAALRSARIMVAVPRPTGGCRPTEGSEDPLAA
jgi:hypothetical protein